MIASILATLLTIGLAGTGGWLIGRRTAARGQYRARTVPLSNPDMPLPRVPHPSVPIRGAHSETGWMQRVDLDGQCPCGRDHVTKDHPAGFAR